MAERVTLAEMNTDEKGTVIEIAGGRGMIARLQALGIREGVKLTKVSAHFARGPVVVQVGETQAAVGFGISRKILVEVDR